MLQGRKRIPRYHPVCPFPFTEKGRLLSSIKLSACHGASVPPYQPVWRSKGKLRKQSFFVPVPARSNNRLSETFRKKFLPSSSFI